MKTSKQMKELRVWRFFTVISCMVSAGKKEEFQYGETGKNDSG